IFLGSSSTKRTFLPIFRKYCGVKENQRQVEAKWEKEVLSNAALAVLRSEEHTSELQSPCNLVCRLLLEKKKKIKIIELRDSNWISWVTKTPICTVLPRLYNVDK